MDPLFTHGDAMAARYGGRTMADSTDFKKTLPAYRAKQGRFDTVDVPTMQFLMVDGHGDPNTAPEHAAAIQALYPVAYTLKFHSKRELGRDYVVPPLEGLWWADDMASFTDARDKSRWSWTMMIMTPDWINHDTFAAAVEKVSAASAPARIADVRLATLAEGTCVQTLHIGSYDDEAPVLARMHDEVIPERGFRMTGQHHEIYLSDARRVAPEKLRTILRQPVAAASA